MINLLAGLFSAGLGVFLLSCDYSWLGALNMFCSGFNMAIAIMLLGEDND